jgi:hypothetical protein
VVGMLALALMETRKQSPGVNIDLGVTLLFQAMKLARTSVPLGR